MSRPRGGVPGARSSFFGLAFLEGDSPQPRVLSCVLRPAALSAFAGGGRGAAAGPAGLLRPSAPETPQRQVDERQMQRIVKIESERGGSAPDRRPLCRNSWVCGAAGRPAVVRCQQGQGQQAAQLDAADADQFRRRGALQK